MPTKKMAGMFYYLYKSLSSLSVAACCISGNTWLYVSRVRVMLAWPSRSLTTLGFSPADNNKVAQLRNPWKVIRGKLSLSRAVIICSKPLVNVRGSNGLPSSVQNTSPLSALFGIRDSADYTEEKTMPKKAGDALNICIYG
jgi:hypothetical protein